MDPFGVREVLQGIFLRYNSSKTVSIPLKSGRCCKAAAAEIQGKKRLNPFEVREVLQALIYKLLSW